MASAIPVNRKRARGAYLADIPPEDRLSAVAASYIAGAEKAKADKAKCAQCYMNLVPVSYCYCAQLRHVSFRHRLFVYTHFKELIQQRTSNTGRLLQTMCGASTFVFGSTPHEAELVHALKQGDLRRTFVLFPASDSLTLDQFQQRLDGDPAGVSSNAEDGKQQTADLDAARIAVWREALQQHMRQNNPNDSTDTDMIDASILDRICALTSSYIGGDVPQDSTGFTIILMDGTWKVGVHHIDSNRAWHTLTPVYPAPAYVCALVNTQNAATLNRRFTSLDPICAAIPRVRLTESSRADFTSTRKLTVEGHLSTAGNALVKPTIDRACSMCD